MLTPDAIEALLQRASRSGTDVATTTADEASEPERAARTALLAPVLETAQKYWEDGSLDIDLVAEKLGDASRDSSWRLPFGDSGLLDFFASLLAKPLLRQSLKIHVLRIIGNSCADTDENRARIVAGPHLHNLINQLDDDPLIPFAVPVLFNVLVDYEPAQVQACEARLSARLVALVGRPDLGDLAAFLNLVCKILSLLVSQELEASVAAPHAPMILLGLSANQSIASDAEDFTALLSVATRYLAFPALQQQLVDSDAVPLLLKSYAYSLTDLGTSALDEEDAANLAETHTAILKTLADISHLPSFQQRYSLPSEPLTSTLLSWLESSQPSPLKAAACLVLGNLSRSDAASLLAVQSLKVHLPLVSIILDPTATDGALLYPVLAYLKNLAIPPPNREALGDAGLLSGSLSPSGQGQGLIRIWDLDALPQAQYLSASLARILVTGTPANVKRLCAPLSADPWSPAHRKTQLHKLIDLFRRADAEPTKAEAARVALAICRVLHSPSAGSSKEQDHQQQQQQQQRKSETRAAFYAAHDRIPELLLHLLTQPRFPTLRSETIFVLALMCRSPDGTALTWRLLQNIDAFGVLVEAATGRKFDPTALPAGLGSGQVPAAASTTLPSSAGASVAEELGLQPQQFDPPAAVADPAHKARMADPAHKARMARVDRENAVVLLSELLKHLDEWGDEEDLAFRKGYYQDVLREAGILVMQDRDNGQTMNPG